MYTCFNVIKNFRIRILNLVKIDYYRAELDLVGWLVFYGILSLVAYLKPNPVYIYIYIYIRVLIERNRSVCGWHNIYIYMTYIYIYIYIYIYMICLWIVCRQHHF